ncbi:MAG: TULIP family P47-like protein [Acidobacteriota bacterium]
MSTNQGSGNIDLMGWDTVFALRLDAVNQSIVAQKTTPATFDGVDKKGGGTVKGEWEAWSVTGGEGDGILLHCPVKSGTLTVEGLEGSHKLDGGWVEVMITLVKEKSDAELPDSSAKPGSGTTHVFRANQTDNQFESPKVQGMSYDFSPGFLNYAAQDAFTAYFTDNISVFNAVFAAVREEETAVEADKQWLKPALSVYALARPAEGATLENSGFGVLSLVNPPSGSTLPQQNFDLDMFKPFAKTETKTNSVFAVSAPLAMTHIVQQSAVHCVMGATMDDFKVTNSGITVTNKNTLNWGNFVVKKGSPAVTPVIKPGDFELTLDGMDFHLNISQAAFTTPDGTADVKLTADQYFNMGAVKLANGKYYFKPDKGLGTNSIRADVSPNKGFEIAMIIESIVIGVALGFLGAGLGEAAGEAVNGAVDGSEGVITAGQDGIDNALDGSGTTVEDVENDAATDATRLIQDPESDSSGETGIVSNKWKVWGGVIGGMFGIPIGVLPQIMTAIWNGDIHQGNVPTVDQFATNFTGAVQWPEVSDWQVTGGTFRSAFLLGGNAKS